MVFVSLFASLVLAHGCGTATARSAIKSTHVEIPMLSGMKAPADPKYVGTVICFDFTRDGRTDMAVSIASGGTAGDIAWILFTGSASGWKVAHTEGGYKLGLYRLGGDVATSVPVYKKPDPNCCPTGGYDHERWHWNGSKLALARRWHDKSYKV